MEEKTQASPTHLEVFLNALSYMGCSHVVKQREGYPSFVFITRDDGTLVTQVRGEVVDVASASLDFCLFHFHYFSFDENGALSSY